MPRNTNKVCKRSAKKLKINWNNKIKVCSFYSICWFLQPLKNFSYKNYTLFILLRQSTSLKLYRNSIFFFVRIPTTNIMCISWPYGFFKDADYFPVFILICDFCEVCRLVGTDSFPKREYVVGFQIENTHWSGKRTGDMYLGDMIIV